MGGFPDNFFLLSVLARLKKKYRSPVFVLSKDLSTNRCHHLWRVNASFQGKISLPYLVYYYFEIRTTIGAVVGVQDKQHERVATTDVSVSRIQPYSSVCYM